MAQWHDSKGWMGLVDGSACPICLRGQPLDVVYELEATWVTMSEQAPMRGYACLVSRRHVVELHDLTNSEGAAFMRDVQRLSSVLATVPGAVKLNYEVHGNTLPHLHMHFFPRFRNDPFEGGPINLRTVTERVYAEGEFVALRQNLIDRLGAGAA
ncbi:MAG: HIT family protein [Gemmatimonadales bacterium]